jgi:hypothetical protein
MNIVVASSRWRQADIKLLYADEDVKFVDDVPVPNLLVALGIFPSTSKARHAGRVGDIPKGWTEYKASKKETLWIWNPTE